MASYNDFEPDEVREIAKNFPELDKLMDERKQLKIDSKNSPTHTKLDPYPKPEGDIFIPKNHKEKDGEKTTRKNIFEDKLKENSKKIETTFNDCFENAGLNEMSQWAKEDMTVDELTVFMEKGYDKVLEEREKSQEFDIRMDEKEAAEFYEQLENQISYFDDNSKDMDVKKDDTQPDKSDFQKNLKDISDDFE